ncbi:succinate dehydrogenase [Infirmifilum lucidum]|uniref:Succinate dehydrogenase n=1 Tax=Infirmifilum lucidum TaxID=2776706 RepID=A0A7L9FJV8_9CREN|nr:succinate dehydrogenase [Infirmifilum lucidum]QOJ79214.1 succinate dehydrogenase [Infirmifilum lucidum]
MELVGVLKSWFRVRGRSFEHFSFSVRRLTGVVMALYLLLHLIDISTLVLGKEAYDALLGLFGGRLGLVADSLLWSALVLHGTLGVYSAIVELGYMLEHRRLLLILAWALAVVLIAVGVWVIACALA